MVRKTLLLVLACMCLPLGDTEAQLFRRRQRVDCPDCVKQPSSSPGQFNRKGGFIGRVPDEEFEKAPQMSVVVKTESMVVEPAKPEVASGTVAEAQAALKQAEAAAAKHRKSLREAIFRARLDRALAELESQAAAQKAAIDEKLEADKQKLVAAHQEAYLNALSTEWKPNLKE